MTVFHLAGLGFLAYGLPLALVVVMGLRTPTLFLPCAMSMLCWFASFFSTSILALFIRGMGGDSALAIVVVGTITQELARAAFAIWFLDFSRKFSDVASNRVVHPINMLHVGIVAGAAYALMHGFFTYGPFFMHAFGPGVLFTDTCSHISLFTVSAILMLGMSLLDIALTVHVLLAHVAQRLIPATLLALALRLASELMAMVAAPGTQLTRTDGCVRAIPGVFIIALLSIWLAYATVVAFIRQRHAKQS